MMPITKTLSRQMCVAVVLLFLLSPLHAQQYGWKVIARPTQRHLYAVEFVDSLHGWCTGDHFGRNLYFTKDGGLTWQAVIQPSTPNLLLDVSFSDLLHGWVVGNFYGDSGGLIWRTNDGGNSWIEQVAPRSNYNRRYLNTAAQSLTHNTTTGLKDFVFDTSITMQTTNGGATWRERIIADSLERFEKVEFVDSLHGWISTGFTLNGKFAILRTVDGGKSWEIFPTLKAFVAISFIDRLRGWAITYDYPTYAYYTADGGATWQRISGRIWDPLWDDLGATDIAFVDSLHGWAFGGMFYRGIITEVIYHTTDGGKTWLQESVGLTGDFGSVNDAKMLDRSHGWAVCNDGSVLRYQLLTEVAEKIPQLPRGFALQQNYPNPFNVMTNIEYEVNRRTVVNITIYDFVGREVQQLINSTHEPGVYRLRFDGSHLSSGVYYYTMKAGSFSETKSMTLLK